MATIRILAQSGQTVSLYLGSDAAPDHRQELLYPVTVGSNDIHVLIRTKPGRVSVPAEVGAPVRRDQPTAHGDKRDDYEAVLTGEIWQRFSHCYDMAQARSIVTAAGETDALMLKTLDTIYEGSVNPSQDWRARFDNGASCQIRFQTGADANCRANIAGYQWESHFGARILTRVHPHAWLALLQAARDTQVSSLMLTSTWRPMTGQSPHRLGLGLDVKEVRDARGREVVFDITNKNSTRPSRNGLTTQRGRRPRWSWIRRMRLGRLRRAPRKG
ncbi:MAG: hypothetical protein Q7T87_10995 [Polaromonas sp.]|nr:hypothetical protein [Polaromonas sp.]